MSEAGLPMTVLGGYLGAGKTTLVNRVLADPGGRRIAVLVNDFGSVNVDAALIADHDGTTMSLANGCVCCSFADGLGMALADLRDTADRFDHVIIEVSGVGDPWKVGQWGRTPGFTLAGVVVLAAADSIVLKLLDPLVGDTVRNQICGGDVVLVTRSDLADPTEALATVAGLTDAPTWAGSTVDISLDVVLGPVAARGVGAESPHHTFSTATLPARSLHRSVVEEWLDRAPRAVWRVKGVLDDPAHETSPRPYAVQKVGRRVEVTDAGGIGPTGLVVVAEATSPDLDEWLDGYKNLS